ncbi:nuclear transport factor 2 family protein [Mycobacterium sp. shizuoka-1]|uniref:nuclear transport factor 2 family protein n=1 Tax=Mycobacterium sp. shizuoka-1 TaxID=2039281 RepID=UPI000C0663E8|nr:nuclear transport factor 2 family protein [Mycobacterium sp. shizuoka-1]GAY14984.1 polyketide cyclase [Mycobacterium sp. shizuoka-1]
MSSRDEITELLYRYAELIDSGDFDSVGQLLSRATFGGTYTPRLSGAQDIAGLFAATIRRFPDTGSNVAGPAAPGTPKTRHLVLNAIVDIDGDTAAARSTFLVVQATDTVPFQPIVAGRYDDRFARDADGWYFTERKVDVEMIGDVSAHLMIDPHQFDR